MKFIRIIKIILCLCVMAFCFTLSGTAINADYYDITDELKISGADKLFDELSDDTKQLLNDSGITEISYEALSGMSIDKIFGVIFSLAKEKISSPIKFFALITAVILLNSFLSSFKNSINTNSSTEKVLSIVSVLSIFAILSAPITNVIKNCSEAIVNSSNFMLSFIPVFVSTIGMSGKVATGGIYSSFLFTAVQILSQIISNFLLPLISVYLALSITGAIGTTVNLSGIAETIKKTVFWTIGIVLTVFVGLMSFQSIVASSADSIGIRTAKYIIDSTVPIVGGAISEALNSLNGCLGLLKSTVGVFGIIVTVVTYLPIIVEALLIVISLNIASFIGDVLGDSGAVKIIKVSSSAVTIVLSIVVISMLLTVVSTTTILVITSGG